MTKIMLKGIIKRRLYIKISYSLLVFLLLSLVSYFMLENTGILVNNFQAQKYASDVRIIDIKVPKLFLNNFSEYKIPPSSKIEWSFNKLIIHVSATKNVWLSILLIEQDGDSYTSKKKIQVKQGFLNVINLSLEDYILFKQGDKGDGKKLQYISYISYNYSSRNQTSSIITEFKLEFQFDSINTNPKYYYNIAFCKDMGIYCFFPNYTQLFDGNFIRLNRVVEIKTNSEGYRGKNYNQKNCTNCKTIAVLGDSFTFGEGVNENETYPHFLEKLLNSNLDNNFQVMNFGIPGYNTEEEMKVFEMRVKKYHPDMIIVGFGFDDLFSHQEEMELKNNLAITYFNENYSFLNITEKKEITSKSWEKMANNIISLPIYNKHTMMKTLFSPLLNYQKVSKVNVAVVSFWTVEEWENDLIRELCSENNWCFIPIQLNKNIESEFIIHPKDGHPNKQGHKLISETIFEKIKSGENGCLIKLKE